MMLYALRRMSVGELAELPDVGEGFENVLYRAVRSTRRLADFFDAIKSKRYTLARCKRIAVCALLGINKEQVQLTLSSREGSYLRVLGFQKTARPLLGEIAKKRSLPMFVRNNDLRECSLIVQRNVETDMLSTDILTYATNQDLKRDMTGPVII
jgi:predicted nucleotidyltransferase